MDENALARMAAEILFVAVIASAAWQSAAEKIAAYSRNSS